MNKNSKAGRRFIIAADGGGGGGSGNDMIKLRKIFYVCTCRYTYLTLQYNVNLEVNDIKLRNYVYPCLIKILKTHTNINSLSKKDNFGSNFCLRPTF